MPFGGATKKRKQNGSERGARFERRANRLPKKTHKIKVLFCIAKEVAEPRCRAENGRKRIFSMGSR